MKRYLFNCTLLSDIVISSTTATEGFQDTLDYIPGSKFLGIAASKMYDESSKDKTLNIFHSGQVRFGNAYPLLDGAQAFPVPFNWFTPKGEKLDDGTIYLHHNLTDTDLNKIYSKHQIKQVRDGYFGVNGSFSVPTSHFSLRSAYDSAKRKAEDEKMFGYYSLPKDTIWSFVIEDDSGNYIDGIKSILEGKKHIGRSKSSEYGLVFIEYKSELNGNSINATKDNRYVIYAQSNLCFYDEYGKNVLMPSATQLGFSDGKILWEQSQVRHRLYQTWNTKRHNRDADRMIMEKGSVLVVESNSPPVTDILSKGVGSHLQEGFGKILVNPEFLTSNSITLQKIFKKVNLPKIILAPNKNTPSNSDQLIMNFIKQRQKKKEIFHTQDEVVKKFLEQKDEFSEVSSSQWGMIRAYAGYAADWGVLHGLLFNESTGALHRGQSEKVWRKNNRREKLLNFLEQYNTSDKVQIVIKIAAEMAKRKAKNDG